MDDPGWHARRRAEHDFREAARHPRRYEDTQPLEDLDNNQVRAEIEVPGVKEHQTGYEVPGYRPPPAIRDHEVAGGLQVGASGLQGAVGDPGPPKGTPAAREIRMQPHLQLQCGPMLRYDTVVDGIYHAFALVVTADTGSDYATQPPFLTYRFTPQGQSAPYEAPTLEQAFQTQASIDTEAKPLRVSPRGSGSGSSGEQVYRSPAQKIFNYHSLTGGNSFWRFKLEIPLSQDDMAVRYSLNGGREITFVVPGLHQDMRWVGHSCNGFSAGVDTEAFNGPDPLWNDLLKQHHTQPIHVLVGGGDQIYCDAIAKEPELVPWMEEKDEKVKMQAVLTDEIRFATDRFYFNHYTKWFRNGAFGRAIACIPMANILDDHDLIDGFGSYPDDLQSSPVFSHIGARGIFWYLLFQNFIVQEYDGSHLSIPHCYKSLIKGGQGPWVPFINHSFLMYLGPSVRMLLLDCRTERKKTQVISELTYERVFAACRTLPSSVNHLVVLLGVPIAYPRMVFAEAMLDSKFNPLTLLGKSGVAGFTGMVNKFNGEFELLDDLNDHWTAKTHKAERNWLILEFQKVAVERRLRITYLSGDVHLAAVGRLFDTRKIPPELDPKYSLNIISSAIVNTPPPMAIVGLQGKLNRTHKTLHHANTDENMLELFHEDTDGKKLKNPCFLGRRNYCIASTTRDGSLNFDIRVEIEQGVGDTKGYLVPIPPPRW